MCITVMNDGVMLFPLHGYKKTINCIFGHFIKYVTDILIESITKHEYGKNDYLYSESEF